MSTQVSHPLTLVMNLKSASDGPALAKLLADNQPTIDHALEQVGTVHFARFVFLSPTELTVITSYDGSFPVYIQAFTNYLGETFDGLLSYMRDAPPLPVKDNLKAFEAYIMANDRSRIDGELQSLYCAYPNLTVQDILALEG